MAPWFVRASAAAACTFALTLLAGAAQAGSLLVEGDFSNDDDLWVASFDLVQFDTLSVTTFSYVGDPGRGIPGGGFAPVLTLFQDGYGLLQVAQGNAACSPAAALLGYCWDATFTLSVVNAGHYTLVLSQDGNDALGQSLAEGYSQTGNPDYTSIYDAPGSRFMQIDGTQRNGHYALEITAPLSPAVPEPGAALMLLAGLAGLARMHRRARP